MRRPTNPAYNPSDVHASGSKIHGTIHCPHRCSACTSGAHHWMEYGCDPEDVRDGDDFDIVLRFDKANGTEHLLGFYACKHCTAWAEYDAFDDLDDDEDAQPAN